MFRYEKEMIPVIKTGLVNKYKFNYVFEEFPSGLGYVDIAASKKITERSVYADSIELIYVISKHLNRRNKKLSPQHILKKHNLNSNITKAVIDYLRTNELVYTDDFGDLYLINRIEPAVQELYTIEAKLKNWKTAIFQARRNFSFATKSYVAFPANQINQQKIELCKKNKVGLISVFQNDIEILIKSKVNKNIDKVNFFYTAETFSSKVKKSTGSNNRYDVITPSS